MFTLNKETLYAPFNPWTGSVGYAIGPNKKELQEKFCELMGTGTTWDKLKEKGWKIIPVDLDSTESNLSKTEQKQFFERLRA